MGVREQIVADAEWSATPGIEPQIHYSQLSHRFDALGHPRTVPLETDCSGLWTVFCNWNGAEDPNGRGYNRTGWTGPMLDYLEPISLQEAQLADLVFYGPDGGDHVAGIIGDAGTANPLLVSHGQERGPIVVRHAVEVDAHRDPVRVRRIQIGAPATPPLTPPPPPPIPGGTMLYLMEAREDTLGPPDKDGVRQPDSVVDGGAVYVMNEDLEVIAQSPNPEWLIDAHSVIHERVLAPTPGATFGTETSPYWFGRGVGNVWVVPGEFLRPLVK